MSMVSIYQYFFFKNPHFGNSILFFQQLICWFLVDCYYFVVYSTILVYWIQNFAECSLQCTWFCYWLSKLLSLLSPDGPDSAWLSVTVSRDAQPDSVSKLSRVIRPLVWTAPFAFSYSIFFSSAFVSTLILETLRKIVKSYYILTHDDQIAWICIER